MKRNVSIQYFIGYLFLLMIILGGCSNTDRSGKQQNGGESEDGIREKPGKCQIIRPQMYERFTLGTEIQIEVGQTNSIPGIDSMLFVVGGEKIGLLTEEPYTFGWISNTDRVGETIIRLTVYYDNNTTSSNHVTVVLKSDLKPENLLYSIVNTYPHDEQAYTQGLVYEDGYLYEGTGKENESSLRKVEITTGEPIRILNLPGDIFGEGIAIFQDKIFQLTYKSQVGFVYDKESFTRLQRVRYQNKEGWGLTHDSTNLIMSDGSNLIYYMDPVYFTEIRRLEVFDDNGPVNRLNELEYIDGKIFANLYGKDEIVVINPQNGKVTGKLDFSGILAEEDQHRRIDVFNGIAWDPEKRRMFVTGKYWPKLFEVTLHSEF